MTTIDNIKENENKLSSLKKYKAAIKSYSDAKNRAAVKSYSEAIFIDPTAIDYGNRAAAYLMIGQHAKALEDAKLAQQIDPTKGCLSEAVCLLVFGVVDDSIRICEDILKEKCQDNIVQLVHEKALKIKKLISEVEESCSEKDLSSVVSKLDQCLYFCSQSLRLKSLREAAWLLVFGKVDESLRICEDIIKEKGQNIMVQLVHEKGLRVKKLISEAEASYSVKDYSSAVSKLNQCLDFCSKSLKLKSTMAECLVFLDKRDDAKQIVSEIFRQDASFADAIYVKGLCFYYANSMGSALETFEHVLKLDPDHAKAKDVYAKAEKFIKGMNAINQACQKGNVVDVVNISQAALLIDPSNKVANSKLHCHVAYEARIMGQHVLAIDNCSRAIELDYFYAEPYYIRGECYLALKQFQKAVKNYETLYGFDQSVRAYRLLQEVTTLNQGRNIKTSPTIHTSYYTMLGISRDATDSEIRKGYRKTALLHHPDKHPNAPDEIKKYEEQKFKELKKAYDVLSDPFLKSRYDNELDRKR